MGVNKKKRQYHGRSKQIVIDVSNEELNRLESLLVQDLTDLQRQNYLKTTLSLLTKLIKEFDK